MNPLNTKHNTHNKNILSEQVDSAPEASSRKAADKKEELVRAPSLSAAPEAEISIQDRHPEVKQEEASGLTEYALLASLPTEVIAQIASYLSQKDLCNFCHSICPYIMEAYRSKSKDDAKTGVLEKKPYDHWSVRLLEIFLRETRVHIHFDQSMSLILDMAKRLGLTQVLDRVPSMSIDFERSHLSYEQVMAIFKKMSIGVKQLEFRGIDKAEIDFSTKYFPNLQTLKIGHSWALESLELYDENVVLKELSVYQCPSLKTIDLQSCGQLNRLDCLSLSSLQEIKMVEKNQLKEFTLRDCPVENLNLAALASFLSQSCVKLSLKASDVKYRIPINQFISKLEKLREVELTGLVISLKDFFSPLCLEKINLQSSTLDLDGACAGALKELSLMDSKINNRDCLKRFTALEGLGVYTPESNQEFSDTLVGLNKLKRLSISCTYIDNLGSLASLPDLEELVVADAEHLSENSLAVLSGFKKLKKLSVDNLKIENLDFLVNSRNLEQLNLYRCSKLTAESFDALRHLTKLKRLELAFTHVENLGFLEALRYLEVLNLRNCYRLAEDSLEIVARLKSLKCLNLQRIWGRIRINLSSRSLNCLKKLVNLEELDLNDNFQLSNEDCAFLAHLKNLKKLNLRQVSLKDMDFLKELTKLEDLDLMCCRELKFENLAVLKCLTKLRRLNLNDIPVEDLALFEDLKQLEYIDLEGTTAFYIYSRELAVFPSGCKVDGLRDISHHKFHNRKILI